MMTNKPGVAEKSRMAQWAYSASERLRMRYMIEAVGAGNSGDTIHIYRLPDRSWRQSSLACPESTRRECRRFPRWVMRCGIPGATTRAIRAMSPAYSSRDAK